MESEIINAAGAVLWRYSDNLSIEVALIHRPRYDDWSFPKGKVENGESEINCAFREVLEETGFQSQFGPQLCQIEYMVGENLKKVTYWSAEAIGEAKSIYDVGEIDQVIWISISEAYNKLSRLGDQQILKNFEKFGVGTKPLILLRHGKAIEREEWEGDDGDRPLAQLGQLQAKRILSQYLPYAVDEIHSSDAVRCYETVAPMARALSINIYYWTQLSEYEFEKNRKSAIRVVQEIIEGEARAIVCGHNPVIPKVVSKLIGKKSFKGINHSLLPGEAWILHHRDGEVIALDWIAAPSV